jgi:chemotaxis protein MotB
MQEGTPIIIKKKKNHGHGHHGGAWKVAYADFVTAMMAFFMVLWIIGMSDEEKELIAGYFNDPAGFMKSQQRSAVIVGPDGKPYREPGKGGTNNSDVKSELDSLQDIHEEIEKALAAGGEGQEANMAVDAEYLRTVESVEIELTREGVLLTFHEQENPVFFELGSAKLRPEGRRTIEQVAEQLVGRDWPMIISGHTDAVPYGGGGYDNFNLSTDRAHSVRTVFLQSGIDPATILAVHGRADRMLKYPDRPFDALNRRVTVLLPRQEASGDLVDVTPGEYFDRQLGKLRNYASDTGSPITPEVSPAPINLSPEGQKEEGAEDS